VNSGIQPFQNLTTTDKIKSFGGDDAQWVKGFVGDGLAALARMLAHRGVERYCVGEYPTVADCFLVPQLASARRFGVSLHGMHAQLLGIEERCLALPAFQQAAPDQQPDAVK
jgi:glutathione S-transferase